MLVFGGNHISVLLLHLVQVSVNLNTVVANILICLYFYLIFNDRNDHLLVHKRTVHPDQYTDDYLLKKQGRPAGLIARDVPSKVLTVESPSIDVGAALQQSPQAVQQPLDIPSLSSPSLSPPLMPKNLSTNNRYESTPEEDLHNEVAYLHRQPYQSQLHQPQFPYPQMISAQAFLQGAMSHLAQQQQHQSQMWAHHPQYSNSDRHPKSNQYVP